MEAQKLQIKLGETAYSKEHQVILNGVDITRSVRSIAIDKREGEPPVATIELLVTVNA